MEIPDRINKAYVELLATVSRQGVTWVNPRLHPATGVFGDDYFYVMLDSATEIIDCVDIVLFRVLFYNGVIRVSYRICDDADF